SLSKSVERLSSGMRINSAKDDAAGLAVRELIRADVAQLGQSSRNAQDAVSMLQTAEGAMGVMDDILVRMKELAEQAATGSYSTEQREIMNSEYSQLADEITRIATSTKFNGTSLLDGTTSAVSFHLGSGSISFSTDNMQATQIANNASLNSSAAVKETGVLSARTVASAGDDYIFDAEIDATHKIVQFNFATDGAVTVDLTNTPVGGQDIVTDGGGISLNQLVEEINEAAGGKAVASAVYDEDWNGYRLKVEAATAGAGNGLTLGSGANDVGIFDDEVTDMTITAGADSGTVDLTTQTGAEGALTAVTAAIKTKDEYRAKLGYMMNRLESAVSILDIQAENLKAAESRISDVDVSTEMAAMTRNQVLSQAGISMLAQANSMPQMALKLLG
ncbi:MAG: hypothetical protein EHM48_01215, partial [Planctomycetaceae bacterium]